MFSPHFSKTSRERIIVFLIMLSFPQLYEHSFKTNLVLTFPILNNLEIFEISLFEIFLVNGLLLFFFKSPFPMPLFSKGHFNYTNQRTNLKLMHHQTLPPIPLSFLNVTITQRQAHSPQTFSLNSFFFKF